MPGGFTDRLPGPLQDTAIVLKGTITEFGEDNAARLAAALAYYASFSIAPLLLIIIAVVGFLWESEEQEVQARLMTELAGVIGQDGAAVIQTMLESASDTGSGTIATILGIAGLLWGATRIFAQLQGALNDIWEVRPKPGRGLKSFVSTRVLSFGMVLVMGLLLLMALVFSALLSALSDLAVEFVTIPPLALQMANFFVSVAIMTLLFAAIYRYLPDAEIAWRDVWVGAFFTALLFNIGKHAISLYLANSSTASTYGAAGSFVLLLFWIYYSALIFFFGAELTQVYARHFGHRIDPSPHAIRVHSISAAEFEEWQEGSAPAGDATAGRQVVVERARPPLWKLAAPVVAAFIIGRMFNGRN